MKRISFWAGLLVAISTSFVAQNVAFASAPVAGKEIASCVTTDSFQHREDGTELEIYRVNNPRIPIMIVVGKPGEKALLPPDRFELSPDQSTLKIQFARYVIAIIHRGTKTTGTEVIALGAPAATLSCTANW